MRLLVLSDLHLEFAGFQLTVASADFDAVVLAGDIMVPRQDMQGWSAALSRISLGKPVVVVAGNHEFYGGVIQRQRKLMQQAGRPNVHFLDPGEVLLDQGRVRVLGCTLWTDFRLPVLDPGGPISDPMRAMKKAAFYLADYVAIDFGDTAADARQLAPSDTLALHNAERAWLAARLSAPFAGVTVVVTHHAPCSGSVASMWASDWLTPAFVSELPDAFFDVPALWIHGHTHTSFDYRRGRARILCNPRGYVRRDGSSENPLFDSGLVVDVSCL